MADPTPPGMKTAFKAKSQKKSAPKQKKRSRVKTAVLVGGLAVAGALSWNLVSDYVGNDSSQRVTYEEKRDHKLNVFHSETGRMIDEYAANLADITDSSRAGQYKNDIEGNLEQLLLEALTHGADDVTAPIQTSIADKYAMSIAQKYDFKVAFDDQVSEYGAVYHPEEKIVAINANVPLEQAAIYARNALHHISFMRMNASELLDSPFAIDITAQENASVNSTVLRESNNNMPENFNPPKPPQFKSAPGT